MLSPGESPGSQGSAPHQAPVGRGSPLRPPRRLLICGLYGWDLGWGGAGRDGKELGEWVGPLGPRRALLPQRPQRQPSSVTVAPQGRPCPRHPSSAGRVRSPVPQAGDPAGTPRLHGGSAVQPSAARTVRTRPVGGRSSAVSSQQAPPPGDGQAQDAVRGEPAPAVTCPSPHTRPAVRRRVSRARRRKLRPGARPAESRREGARLCLHPEAHEPQLLPLHPECRACSQALLLRSGGGKVAGRPDGV